MGAACWARCIGRRCRRAMGGWRSAGCLLAAAGARQVHPWCACAKRWAASKTRRALRQREGSHALHGVPRTRRHTPPELSETGAATRDRCLGRGAAAARTAWLHQAPLVPGAASAAACAAMCCPQPAVPAAWISSHWLKMTCTAVALSSKAYGCSEGCKGSSSTSNQAWRG